MATKDLLLEIGLEEIPARFMAGLLKDMEEKASSLFTSSRISHKKITASGTGRRLVLFAQGLPAKQEDLEQEVRGPQKAAAFDASGGPTVAAKGFAAANKADVKDLFVKEAGGKEYIYVLRKDKGKDLEEALKDLLPQWLSSLYLPVSMRWGDGDTVFIRPVHYVMAFLGDASLKIELAGKISSDKVDGHRFLAGNEMFKYDGGADLKTYSDFILKKGVVLDREKRLGSISDAIGKYENETGNSVVKDPDLLDEVANIVENPVVLTGSFRKEFSGHLPQDVIDTVVKKQQKCFPVHGSSDFLIVADGRNDEVISRGYEQVVNSRLSDAKFFLDEDMKRTLEEGLEKMKKIVYHEKLGSMWDKTERNGKLAQEIASLLGLDNTQRSVISKIALLAKADLVTHMVGEFAVLSGIMGREYALRQGKDKDVADGIFEHYLPRFSGDRLPEGTASAVVSIADKLDTVCSCFKAGIIPSGSEDPYGLRRAAVGIVAVVLGSNMTISLSGVIEKAFEVLGGGNAETKAKVRDFVMQRLKAVLEAEGIRYDISDSVSAASDDVVKAYCTAFKLKDISGSKELSDVVLASDRVRRIIGKLEAPAFSEKLLADKEEKDLYSDYTKISGQVETSLEKADISQALRSLSGLAPVLEVFFEKVLVMHKDPAIKGNRIALLRKIDSLFLSVADLTKIVL